MRYFIALVFVVACAPLAGAHAFLDHAEPKVGGVVESSPAEVKIWFTQDVSAKESRLKVFDAKGDEVDRKDAHRDPKNHSLLVATLSALPAGEYQVRWEAVCLLGHHTSGKFMFKVKTKDR